MTRKGTRPKREAMEQSSAAVSAVKARQSTGSAPVAGSSKIPESSARSGWIISPVWDTVLFIAAPLVSIGVLFPLRVFWASQDYAYFLLAFVTFGHHLPGFIRAYGDSDLFAHYRRRFLLAPPVIFTATLLLQARGLHGLLMLTFTWDIWHLLMQHYGFMRIYDAKQREFSPWTARMDLAFSLTCYIALVVASPHYRNNLLYLAYQSGLPLLSEPVFSALETVLYSVAGLTATAYAGYNAYLWTQRRHNVRKLATLAAFVGATYFLYVRNDDFVVGYAVWSGFHCLQYYGIVWVFNRTRAERGGGVTKLVRFLFRPKVGLALLNLALIFLYGGIDYLQHFVGEGALHSVLLAFIVTSTLLHYYFDGFIWKVREHEMREPLNIAAAPAPKLAPSSARSAWYWLRRLQPNYRRGLFQVGYLAAFVLLVTLLETGRPNEELEMHQSLATIASGAEEAHLRLGEALRQRGRTAEAARAYQRAVKVNPGYSEAHVMLGLSLATMGRITEAAASYDEALRTDPSNTTAHFNLAGLLESQGEVDSALEPYRQATEGTDADAKRLAREAIRRLESGR